MTVLAFGLRSQRTVQVLLCVALVQPLPSLIGLGPISPSVTVNWVPYN